MTTNLKDVKAGYGLTTTINANNDTISSELDTKLSRTLGGFNSMEVPLDMGNNAIVNLPDAVSESSPITLRQAAEIEGVENPLTTESVGGVLYPRTAEESAASIADYDAANTAGDIVNPQYPPGNVLRYGADPTDINHDDRPAFLAALDAYGHAYVPEGDYFTVLTPIDLETGHAITGTTPVAKGNDAQARGSKIYAPQGLIDTGVVSDGKGVNYDPREVHIENLLVRSQADEASSSKVAYDGINGIIQGTIKGCMFRGFDTAIFVYRGWFLTIEGNYFKNHNKGIFIDAGNGSAIRYNEFSDSGLMIDSWGLSTNPSTLRPNTDASNPLAIHGNGFNLGANSDQIFKVYCGHFSFFDNYIESYAEPSGGPSVPLIDLTTVSGGNPYFSITRNYFLAGDNHDTAIKISSDGSAATTTANGLITLNTFNGLNNEPILFNSAGADADNIVREVVIEHNAGTSGGAADLDQVRYSDNDQITRPIVIGELDLSTSVQSASAYPTGVNLDMVAASDNYGGNINDTFTDGWYCRADGYWRLTVSLQVSSCSIVSRFWIWDGTNAQTLAYVDVPPSTTDQTVQIQTIKRIAVGDQLRVRGVSDASNACTVNSYEFTAEYMREAVYFT